MVNVSISNPVAHRLEGVEFTGTRGGIAQRFLVPRDGLEDLDYNMLETPAALLEAFGRHQDHIAEVAAKALDGGKGGPAAIVLNSLLL
ncbi:MAG TPA: DUF1488 family protein [Ramlibacter sp.]|nr:DUF1488 family protein [Ramlibacter sp.]